MSEITRTSFYYDPIRSGYDTNSWRTISGAPAVSGSGRIVVDAGTGIAGSAIHLADFLKGDISFNINIPSAPAAGDARLFGVSAPNTVAYIRFSIDDALTFQTSDGTTTTESSAVTWDSALSGSNTEFRIRWEAGTAKFYINNALQYTVTDASVPSGPLSLYLFDNSTTAMTIGDINVRGTQSYVMHLASSDSSSTSGVGTISRFESITVTENLAILQSGYSLPYVSGALSESVTVSEAVQISISLPGAGGIFESVTVSENLTIIVANQVPEVFDSVTVTENLYAFNGWSISVSETVTVTENSVVSI